MLQCSDFHDIHTSEEKGLDAKDSKDESGMISYRNLGAAPKK